MKKITLNIGIMAILAVIILPALHVIAANPEPYTLLAPLPNLTTVPGEDPLKTYLPFIFNLAIGLAAVAAVLNIVIGGFQYMTTDAVMKKGEGLKRIQNAIFSLVLIISAWIILYTINPKLLEFNLKITPATTKDLAPTAGDLTPAGTRMTTAQITASDAVRTSLQTEGVFTYAGPCTSGRTTGCVNLNGLTDAAKDGLVLTKGACSGCSMTITGGTEPGHSATGGHPTGNAVDLRPASDLNTVLGFPSPKEGDTKTKVFKVAGKPDITATFTYETLGGNAAGTSSGDHWHVTYR